MTRFQAFSLQSYRVWLAVLVLLLPFSAAHAGKSPLPDAFAFVTPIFGLAAAPDGSLLVADAGRGITELRKGRASQVAALPGVVDVAPVGRRTMFALTSPGDPATGATLFRLSGGTMRPLANLAAFEETVNPDEGVIESNPFDVAAINGNLALVADAAGNSLLVVDQRGSVDWVATFPTESVSTANAQQLFACPDAPPELAFICEVSELPAEAVPTSVAVGPDGAYYVGELKGFPAPIGESRVWRVEPGARNVRCGEDPRCTVVGDGFTSIIDLSFGPDGSLYVTELDAASWLAAESGAGAGGTVQRCVLGGALECVAIATALPLPGATAATRDGVYTAILALVPGQARVIQVH